MRVPYFVVNIVSAGGLAPFGARTSAGTVMTKFRSRVWQDLNVWVYVRIYDNILKPASSDPNTRI